MKLAKKWRNWLICKVPIEWVDFPLERLRVWPERRRYIDKFFKLNLRGRSNLKVSQDVR